MTQLQLDIAVARSTGEPLRSVRRHGFHLQAGPAADLEPEDLHLVLDCPFCRRAVPYPGRARAGAAALAECHRCDVDFEFEEAEVYAAVLRPEGGVAAA